MRMFCFDLDDTLISENEYVESGLRAAGEMLDAISKGPPAGEWLVDEWRTTKGRDLFQRLLAARGLDLGRWLPELISIYRDHSPKISLRPGAAELLDAIVRRGGRLSLISDGPLVAQQRKWEALRIPHLFSPIIFTDAHGAEFWKPNTWAFQQVMASCVPGTQCVYVADNPEKDFVAPNRLGWISIRVVHPDNIHNGRAADGGAPSREILGFEGLLSFVLDGKEPRGAVVDPETAE